MGRAWHLLRWSPSEQRHIFLLLLWFHLSAARRAHQWRLRPAEDWYIQTDVHISRRRRPELFLLHLQFPVRFRLRELIQYGIPYLSPSFLPAEKPFYFLCVYSISKLYAIFPVISTRNFFASDETQ